MVENNLGKGENAGNQHFVLFPKCFQKPPFLELCGKEVKEKKGNQHVFPFPTMFQLFLSK